MDNIYTPITAPKTKLECVGLPIWDNLYKVSIPYCDSMSADYMRLFGMPTVGDACLDKAMHNDLIDMYMSINTMVGYFKEGIVVQLGTHSDSKGIYEIIAAYLQHWKSQLENGINIGDAPIDDLILLDRFAAAVFPHAVQHFKQGYSSSNLVKGLTGSGRWLNRGALFAPKADPLVSAEEGPKHQSLEQLFAESVQNRGGSRWK